MSSLTCRPNARSDRTIWSLSLTVWGWGHGDDEDARTDPNSSEGLLKLDLLTLTWTPARMSNQAFDNLNSAAATLAGGVIFGGVQIKNMSIRLVPKFDFLHLEMCTQPMYSYR